jgi:hypothetical protein
MNQHQNKIENRDEVLKQLISSRQSIPYDLLDTLVANEITLLRDLAGRCKNLFAVMQLNHVRPRVRSPSTAEFPSAGHSHPRRIIGRIPLPLKGPATTRTVWVRFLQGGAPGLVQQRIRHF